MIFALTILARVRAAILFPTVALLTVAAARAETPVRTAAAPVELFAAVEQQSLAVDVFALDSKAVNLQFRNLTDRPLTIKLPAAFAAAPVLTQQPLGNLFGQVNNQAGNNNNSGGNQAIGMGGQNNQNNNRNGLFNVPAEKAIKMRLACVCLEHGKRDPNPRLKYELKPLAEICDDPRVTTVLTSLGNGEVRQSVAQLAAWNLANGKTWEFLAAQKNQHVTGLSSPLFPRQDVLAAKEWVDSLPPPAPASSSVSAR